MACFNVIDSKTLVEIVTQLKPSTCCLDTIPTNLFKNVFDCLAVDILQIVNNSLQSGNFPKALKTAVIKPLLKKRILDTSIINNYRPISNLPFVSKIIEKLSSSNLITSWHQLVAMTPSNQDFDPCTALRPLLLKL